MKPLLEAASPELVEKLFKYGHKKTYWELDIIFAEGEKAEFCRLFEWQGKNGALSRNR
ncbi:MAG: hypothetical protein HC846_11380 [Blastocatellia bacterium]|nr:hypothetical protein [Blastocatellia bacterium]